ncbi:2Fe-2S iron-sulfur cluster-binding protein [Hoeflea sp.]|uniref:2Fe-2S iron-sulfur cluster-binding protein n=1 Tax=Hoeflea sp. TaxID=1940281 RepID=UPI003B52D960
MSDHPSGFTFDDRPVALRPGQSVAAALTESGQRPFRITAKDERRGMFCGMGVCQDCLVTIDGVPNQRACMTPAKAGMVVSTQVAFAALAGQPEQKAPQGRQIAPDVLVIGAGAGGLNAAIAAAGSGASVVVLDERKVSGGQYYKQAAGAASVLDTQQQEGASLIASVVSAGAEILSEVEVWGVFEGLLVMAQHQGAPLVARPRTLIVATGAYERPRMVPGWTLPGVMTTGAAQTLWRSYRTLPGKRVAVAGSGPLNLQVAMELSRGGADVVMVSEAACSPYRQPLAATAMVAAGPRLAARGLAISFGLWQRGVKVSYQTSLSRIVEVENGLKASFKDSQGRQRDHVVDAVCMNEGFEPQNEILRLLGAEMSYDADFGHLRCQRDPTMQTSIPQLYAIGDCAGLGGAPAAGVEGTIAGLAAASYCGDKPLPDLRKLQARLAAHRRFQARLWAMHDIGPRDLSVQDDDLVVCRCEEVSLGELRQALGTAPGHAGTVKRATRAGMGRCQGRYCGPVTARLVADRDNRPVEDRSFYAPRVPIKPVSIAAILAAQEMLDGND